MTKIEKLTFEQEEALKSYHAECMSIGTSTAPADRPKAEAAIAKMYEYINKPKPIFVWCDSPATCILARHVLQECSKNSDLPLSLSLDFPLRDSLRASLGNSLRSSLWVPLRASLGASLWDSLEASLRSSLEAPLGNSLRSSLWASLRAPLGNSLRSSLWAPLRAPLWDSLEASLRASLWDSLGVSLMDSLMDSLRVSLMDSLRASLRGQQEQYWIGFYRFMELHLKIEYDPEKSMQLGWWQDIAQSANWWFPYDGICFVSERPIRCSIDAENRLHHDSLPAMEFRDGWKIWAWHGVTVSQRIIESPEEITAQEISSEKNTEVRRAMIERMGWEKFCEKASMKVLHSDTLTSFFPSLPVSDTVEPHVRMVTSYREGVEQAQLLEAEGILDFEDRPLRFVRLSDPSTGRRYTIRVLHSHTRCYEAIGWTFGKSEEEYKNGIYARQGDVFLNPIAGGPAMQQHS